MGSRVTQRGMDDLIFVFGRIDAHRRSTATRRVATRTRVLDPIVPTVLRDRRRRDACTRAALLSAQKRTTLFEKEIVIEEIEK